MPLRRANRKRGQGKFPTCSIVAFLRTCASKACGAGTSLRTASQLSHLHSPSHAPPPSSRIARKRGQGKFPRLRCMRRVETALRVLRWPWLISQVSIDEMSGEQDKKDSNSYARTKKKRTGPEVWPVRVIANNQHANEEDWNQACRHCVDDHVGSPNQHSPSCPAFHIDLQEHRKDKTRRDGQATDVARANEQKNFGVIHFVFYLVLCGFTCA